MTYKFLLFDMCRDASVKSLKPFILILNSMVFHTTHVSLMFLYLGKIIYLPQPPNLISPVLLTVGSCALDPDSIRL